MTDEWSAERIAALRVLLGLCDNAEWPSEKEQARSRLQREAPAYVRSLLDALESARSDRDALMKAIEDRATYAAIDAQLGVGEWEACVPSHLRGPFFAAYKRLHPGWQ